MLRQRIITGVTLAILIVFIVFKLPNSSIALLFGVITIIGAWEWASLVGPDSIIWKLFYTFIVGIILIATWIYALPGNANQIILVSALWWAAVVIMLAIYNPSWLKTEWLKLLLTISGFIVLIPAWLALVTLHNHGPTSLMYLLVLVWIADIAAYFAGKKFGKHKLAPDLSPGKSKEGLYGALLAVLIFSFVGIFLFSFDKKSWALFTIICLVTALISVIGDLYESLLKRRAGVKDSGKILPGHGGVLDRIDSLTAAAPGFVLGMMWIT